MPCIDALVESPIVESFRVAQVRGMFDMPAGKLSSRRWSVEVPGLSESWQIGLIVGPSGSGKTTIARAAFGTVHVPRPWALDRAVVDGFGDRPIETITGILSAVGLSSPPSWLKTFDALSNGEQFRCNLARALAGDDALVVFDEFTSVVDRTVARIGSAAVSKAVRRTPGKRFVAVSCHYDIREWLEPDWVLDMSTGELARGRLRRPDIELELRIAARADWPLFAPHHYLTAALHPGGRYYQGWVQGRAVGFVATLPTMGHAGARRIHRVVVLPDYQGVGIGMALLGAVAEHEEAPNGMTIRTSHSALIKALRRSANWIAIAQSDGTRAQNMGLLAARNRLKIGSYGRITVSFRYRPMNLKGPNDVARRTDRLLRPSRISGRGDQGRARDDRGRTQGPRPDASSGPGGIENTTTGQAD